MAYLLDSDFIIFALSGRKTTVDALEHLARDPLAVSLISVGEIYEGTYGTADVGAHIAAFRRFLEPFVVLGLDDQIMDIFARVRSDLRRAGQLIPDFDILIAATALRHDLTVLTYNVRHLGRVPGLKVFTSGQG